ncbi:MAG: hypothetical protein HQ549_01115 [Candidatus Omnitrophica bacterium]|nr:hypothetical protein [Candidatus Omnitrophota bacterium]
MRSPKKNSVYFINAISIFLLCFVISGCSGSGPSEKIVVRINEYTLTPDEFSEIYAESGVAEDTPKAREKFIDNLIIRKLLLQEAQKEEIDKQRSFLRSIENLWEQALLKIVIDQRAKELDSTVGVTEEELLDFYNQWAKDHPGNAQSFDDVRELIKWQISKRKQQLAFNAWVNNLKNQANIKIDKKALGLE